MMKAEVMKQKKADNKGFSLVELIIVMAIMAILVGIVGTQAIPYMNRARVSKDRELLSAISTAAVTAYTMNVEDLPADFDGVANLFTADSDDKTSKWQDDVKGLISYNLIGDLNDAASSKDLQTATAIKITFSDENGDGTLDKVVVEAEGPDVKDLQAVESRI